MKLKGQDYWKVSDFEVDMSSGKLYNCCVADVMERRDETAYEGMVIECNDCGEEMVLRKDKDDVLKWMSNRS